MHKCGSDVITRRAIVSMYLMGVPQKDVISIFSADPKEPINPKP